MRLVASLLVGMLLLTVACQSGGDKEKKQQVEALKEGAKGQVMESSSVFGHNQWLLTSAQVDGQTATINPDWEIMLRAYSDNINFGNCQPFSGRVSVAESGDMEISQLKLSANRARNDCDPAHAVLERQLFEFFGEASGFALADSTLTFSGTNGQLVFVKR